jgi:hypothetical protein
VHYDELDFSDPELQTQPRDASPEVDIRDATQIEDVVSFIENAVLAAPPYV